MQTVSCPTCGDPLPDSGGYCARCGEAALASEVTQRLKDAREAQNAPAGGRDIPQEESERLLEWQEAGPTAKLSHKARQPRSETPRELVETTLNLKHLRQGARADLEADILVSFDERLEERDDEIMPGRATWQKVVEHKTGYTPPAVVSVSPKIRRRSKRFRVSLQPVARTPRAFFWLSALALCVLLLAGGFGVAVSFGRSVPRTLPVLSLQASPATIALGGIVTLRGASFTPNGTVALSRDQHIPLVDTGGSRDVQADAHGFLSDTVIVDPAWLAGQHVLYATDIRTHRQALFKLMVTGQNALQGPPRLLLSASTLKLGAGDEATSSHAMLALSNAGGGEVTWQAKISQPWLQISPASGSIPSGSHLAVIVAADRSSLAPGAYQTSLLFISNTEQVSLTVTMTVTPLQPKHEAVLQISPAALAFSGSAQGANPHTQTIMVSNPGVRTLSWGANISPQSASGWLWLTPQIGNIEPGSQQQIILGVSTQNLAPGVYKGEISFANRGPQPIQGNQQSIYVSLTITPPCVLAFAPGNMSFAGMHGGASPGAQSLSIKVAQGCASSQNWSALAHTSSGGGWLSLSQGSGVTPSSPQVSVNTAGLGPGTYNGTLTFTVNTGPQIVPVTLTIRPIPCAISDAASLALQGTAGQASSSSQAVVVTSSGDCPHALNWTSAVSSGATWLIAAPSGTLMQPGTASVNVQATLAGLGAGTYTGTLTITAVDSTSGQTVGAVQTFVTLKVAAPPPPCTLQTLPSSDSTQNFKASVGSTATQTATVTIGATGTCSGSVTITPSSDSSWLTVDSPVAIASGSTATFTATINPTSLVANTYTGTITLAAADGNGAIAGSPQTVTITLTVQ